MGYRRSRRKYKPRTKKHNELVIEDYRRQKIEVPTLVDEIRAEYLELERELGTLGCNDVVNLLLDKVQDSFRGRIPRVYVRCLATFVEKHDLDGNDIFDYDEFKALWEKVHENNPSFVATLIKECFDDPDFVDMMWEHFDRDKNGLLDSHELAQMLSFLFPGDSFDKGRCLVRQASEMMEAFDVDESHSMDREEFVVFVDSFIDSVSRIHVTRDILPDPITPMEPKETF
ncbi:hypothetical protein PCE1_000905 [Barthelona sp. PCE]